MNVKLSVTTGANYCFRPTSKHRTAVIWLKYCRYGIKYYPINQAIQALHNDHIFVIINLISEHSWIKFGNTVIGSEPGSLEGGVHMVWELF